jgi:hypothetical protein
MKFENLKSNEYVNPYPPVKIRKVKYWTKKRNSQLAYNFYLLPELELRKMFGGRSWGTIKSKASNLKRRGWHFNMPRETNTSDLKCDGRMNYVYKITNKRTGKAYIGITMRPDQRKKEHLAGRGNPGIAADLEDGMDFEILASGSLPKMSQIEYTSIIELNTVEPGGYNKINAAFRRTLA